ncbi:MAG: DUF91 domain-containing protein [Crenarchaeota archaeon]|nr:DUF91 domain-containing protein [Thermoproteota archaeon]
MSSRGLDITTFFKDTTQQDSADNCIILKDPEVEEAVKLINANRHRRVIIIYGKLRATYEGRAKASLDLAPRILILKPDGTLLIHESTKREPVIWQPPRAVNYASIEDGVLTIKSTRTNPYEVVKIEIPLLYFLGLFNVGLTENYKVIGTEKDVVDLLVRKIDIVEKGLKIIAREYQTIAGNIDILAEDSNGNIVVIEVKRGMAGPEAVHQLKRYVEVLSKTSQKPVRGILVAEDISSSAYKYLRDYGFKFVRISRKLLEDLQRQLTS